MRKDRESVRAALLAKLEATWGRYKENPDLKRIVESASNADLRKHLAWAECVSETALEPDSDTLSPRYTDGDRRAFGRLRHARWSPGEFGYVLARDECSWYRGPDWVPFNLWQTAEYGSGLEQECAAVLCHASGAESLWSAVAAKYSRPDNLALSLPMACAEVRARWRDIPRMTPSEFREHREKLARHAEQLAVEMERFYLPRDPDEREFSGIYDFQELMTQAEIERFDQAIRATTYGIANRTLKRAGLPAIGWDDYNDIGDDARALGYGNADLHTPARIDAKSVYSLMLRDHVSHWQYEYEYGGVPTIPDMLRRVAAKFADDAARAPIARPNLTNAERNFFARALCKYFWQSRGDMSPAIIRDIVCMFYPQGIDENEVSQMAARVKASHPLPPDPETSGPL